MQAGLALHRRKACGGGKRVGGSGAADIACADEELCRERHPHLRQRAGGGAVRVASWQRREIAVDSCHLRPRVERFDAQVPDQLGGSGLAWHRNLLGLGGVQRPVCQRLQPVQMRGVLQVGDLAGRSLIRRGVMLL